MKKEETKFKEKIYKDLKKVKGSWIKKIQQVAIHGTPDYLGVVRGWPLAIELKTDTGHLSKLQELNIARFKKCGGIAIVMTPQNAEATITFLNNLEWRE